MSCQDCKDQLYEVYIFKKDMPTNIDDVLIETGVVISKMHANMITNKNDEKIVLYQGENDNVQDVIKRLLKANLTIYKRKKIFK